MKNTPLFLYSIFFLLFLIPINSSYSGLSAQFFKSSKPSLPEYVAPKNRSKFYDKKGLVNVDKAFRSKRLSPDAERDEVDKYHSQLVNPSEISATSNSRFYDRKGFVNQDIVTERRHRQESLLPFLYGKPYVRPAYARYASRKPLFNFSISQLNFFKFREKTKVVHQDVVSPR